MQLPGLQTAMSNRSSMASMDARFRDHMRARSAELKSAPEFKDCVQYSVLKAAIDPEKDPVLPWSSRSVIGRAFSKSSVRSDGTSSASFSKVADWHTTIENKILQEAGRIRENIEIVENRLLDSNSFISALHDKTTDGSVFTSGDMQNLLKLQKERDILAKDLDEYKSLNLRALMKLASAFHDAGGNNVYTSLLPRVLQQMRSRVQLPGRKGWDQNLDTFFQDVTQDLGKKETAFVLESRDMIKHQFQEVLGRSTLPEPTKDPAAVRSMWQGMVPPIAKAILTEYSSSHLGRDAMAAVIISVAGIPKAMSYAALAGLPVKAGIATLYLPALVYALLGSSRQVAISPQSVTCLLLGQMVEETLQGTGFEGDLAQQIGVAMTLTFYTGLVMGSFGALNLCFLLKLISKSVLSGFISASAIIAAASTVKSLLGLHVKKSPILYILVERIIAELGHIHWPTALVSAAGISFLVLMPSIQKCAAKRLKAIDRPLARALYMLMRVPSVLYLMALGMLFGSILCSFQPFKEWHVEHWVTGRGATAPALFYERMAKHFSCNYHSDRVGARYHPTSTGDGLSVGMGSTTETADFAAVDVLPPEDADSVILPVVSTFVCAVVNVPFLEHSQQINLVLDVPTVAAIFAGEVQKWSDKRITQANPNLPWESLDADPSITVVVRSGKSGTTFAFTAGLLSCNGCNASLWAPGLTVDWGAPKLVTAEGNSGVVDTVASTPWSIGYATYGTLKAAEDNARCVAWNMGGGSVVTPALAMRYPDKSPWPISFTSYFWIPKLNESSCLSRVWLKRYLETVYAHGADAEQLDYQLLPRPAQLGAVACPGSDTRRLAAGVGGEVADDFTCSLAAPTCSHIQVVGFVDASLPNPTIPKSGVQLRVATAFRYAMMLAAVALLEHVANVQLYADREGYTVSTSTDLVAVGAANMVGALFGSFVVAGGFSRSALNEKAASQLSLLLSVLISFAIVLAISACLSMLPQCVLSVILFCAVVPLVDVRTLVALARLGRHGSIDMLALVVAFIATCFLGVVQGMLLAIMVSLVEFVWKSIFPQISELHRATGSLHYVRGEVEEQRPFQIIQGILELRMPGRSNKPGQSPRSWRATLKVFRFEAPLWFANASTLSDLLLSELRGVALRGIVLDMSTVPWMDSTAANTMKKTLASAAEKLVVVYFANVNDDVKYMLVQVSKVDEEQFFKTLHAAEMAVRAGLPSVESSCTGDEESAVVQDESSDLESIREKAAGCRADLNCEEV